MLLEREELLAALRHRFGEALLGNGAMVLVAGEAGAGKTSLVRAFVEATPKSALVIRGACDPLATPRPMSPIYDFAMDPDAGLDHILSSDFAPMEIFSEILHRLRHTIRPVVLVIEDVHWADAGTLDFLRFIGRRIGDTKAMVACTYRDDEVSPDHPLRPVLGQLMLLESTTRLEVPALSIDAVATLADESAHDPERLWELTGGNAFFVTEVLASPSTIPHTVQDAVLERVGRLDPAARSVVEAVSIAPRSLEIENTTALVDADLDAIDRAVGMGVLVADNLGLRFRHELARAAVEESIPPARRLGLHLRMLGILEDNEMPDLARLAHHAVRAGRSDLVVEHAPRAGDEAVRRGARREAVAFYRAALENANALGPDETARLRVKLGTELRVLDKPEGSEIELRLAIDHYRKTGQAEELADTLGLLQGTLWNLRRFDEGWEAMDEAISLLRPLGPSEALGMALYRIAHNHMLARHARPAFDKIEEAGEVAAATGSVDVEWLVLMMTGCLHIVIGDASEGVRLLQRAVERAEEMGNPRFTAIALGMLGSGGGEARRYEAAIPALKESIEQGLTTDEDYTVAYSRAWLARIAFEQGRWDEAAAYAELVDRTTLQKEGIAHITAMSALGRVRVRRGDPGGRPLLEKMTELARNHELQHGWNAICGRAEHLWLTGRAGEAIDALVTAYDRALDTDSEWARGEIGFWMWRLGEIEAAPDGAARPFAIQIAGDWESAATLWRTIGCPYETAMALADGPVEAKLEALEIFNTMGARPIADRVRGTLRDVGVESIPRGPTRQTLANPAGLTGRQVEVLELMSDGLSNGEIAERLFISKKTVEHHVSAIFTKLGVDTRPRAIAAAIETRSPQI